VAEDGVPGAGGHAGIAAFPAGVLDQVIRGGVTGELAYAGSGGAEGGGGAVQLAGGVGQGLLEPVFWRLGQLLAGAVAWRGGTQQSDAKRGAGAQPGHIQRRGQHRPRVRTGGLGVLPPGDQLRRGRQGLGQPVSSRLQRDLQPRIMGRGGAGSVLLRRAELRADADDCGQVQHFAFPSVRVGAARFRHGGVGDIPVWPQRANDHRWVRGAQQCPHHRAGQRVLAIEVALQLIQPYHRSRRWPLRQRGDLGRPDRIHQPPAGQQLLDRLHRAAGFPDRGPADQQHEPAPLRRGRHLGPDTGLGGIDVAARTSAGQRRAPGTLIAACTPNCRGSASLTRTALAGGAGPAAQAASPAWADDADPAAPDLLAFRTGTHASHTRGKPTLTAAKPKTTAPTSR